MADFFKNFNKTYYDSKEVTNILTSFFLRKIDIFRALCFEQYAIKDEDSIESLSSKLYKDPKHYWTFLIINDIIDPYTEWAMNSYLLEKFVAKKYQNGRQYKLKEGGMYIVPFSVGVNGIHHFININTNRVCDDVEDNYYRELYATNPSLIGKNIMPITNFEYEKNKDIDKRNIFILSNSAVYQFEEEFQNMLRGED